MARGAEFGDLNVNERMFKRIQAPRRSPPVQERSRMALEDDKC